jgi:hypothetical protein
LRIADSARATFCRLTTWTASDTPPRNSGASATVSRGVSAVAASARRPASHLRASSLNPPADFSAPTGGCDPYTRA